VPGSRIHMTATDSQSAVVRGQHTDRNPATCQSCHGDKPHKESFLHAERLNQHTDTLACQSCHIPSFSRGGVPTKMGWDWSTAGRLTEDGKPFQLKDDKGHVIYDSKKGDFILGENVVPHYQWFDGTVDYTQPDTIIDPSSVVEINTFKGTPGAANARIWPVKVFHGKQPYDTVHNTLLVPHTALPNDTAFWFNFDWAKALRAGADSSGRPFSGEFDFVETSMVWPITHMVAPKEQAVSCNDCHSRDGRMKDVPGVYIPGRDGSSLLRTLGWLAALGALIGVLIHTGIRVVVHNKGKSS